MASHSVLTEQLIEMGFQDKQIADALTRLGEKATIESAIETLESEQNGGPITAGTTDGTDDSVLKLPALTAEQTAAESGLSAEEKRALYEERIKLRRKEREEKDKEEALAREIKRREDGKGMGKMKEELEQLQRARLAEDMRREKAAEKAAKDAILRQIALDREDHKRRNAAAMAGATATADAAAAAAPVPLPARPAASLNSDGKTRLAIRLLDGRQLVNEFDSRESLSAVRVYVYTQCSMEGEISFVMPPLPAFTEEDMQKPLNVLGLCPSARVHVIKR
ncbi:unnamed protein product [Medioppia subpectinata]|uniref:UBX domain-containing protein 1 n=1 Tax=Medioppia subpectinata TaxID=1979941 RepID=A0A7R9PY46_9ACAR|nr:unnamed protein product [Medioppia subpectinata]CAG2105042.1 unnamed protein product [Medioppia subpectinata]